MTGVEAISNGIPAFRKPETRNAAITLTWMAVILGTLFIGITVLALAVLSVIDSIRNQVLARVGHWLDERLGPSVLASGLRDFIEELESGR